MADQNSDLIVEILRKIQGTLADHDRQFREVKETLSRIERQQHDTRGDLLRHGEHMAGLEVRLDRMETRLGLRDA